MFASHNPLAKSEDPGIGAVSQLPKEAASLVVKII